jgi:hypothetical protein
MKKGKIHKKVVSWGEVDGKLEINSSLKNLTLNSKPHIGNLM